MEIKSSDLREVVQLLSEGRGSVSPAVATVPPPPEIGQTLSQAGEAAAGVSLLVTMSYRSISGNEKNRDILIRRIIHAKGDLYIDGVAMDIRAPRLIKLGNVTEIRDIGSGRVYTNPYEFVQNRLGIDVKGRVSAVAADVIPAPVNDFAKVIDRLGHEITVLVYLSSIDGVRRKEERQKVIDYVKARTTDLQYDEQELNDYLISIAPDEESFTLALGRAVNKGKETVQGLMEAMVKIIMADNQVDSRERQFLIRMMDLLESEGYEFNLPV